MFKRYTLTWHYPVSYFLEGNKVIDEVRALSKAEAVKYFREKHRSTLDDDGNEKLANGAFCTCEVFGS